MTRKAYMSLTQAYRGIRMRGQASLDRKNSGVRHDFSEVTRKALLSPTDGLPPASSTDAGRASLDPKNFGPRRDFSIFFVGDSSTVAILFWL